MKTVAKTKRKKRNKKEEDSEGRWKKAEEKISILSHSLSSSFQVDISHSGFAEEMEQKHSKLGAKPEWSAHADWPCMSGDGSSTTPIPPWRDQSLWRIRGKRERMEENDRGDSFFHERVDQNNQ